MGNYSYSLVLESLRLNLVSHDHRVGLNVLREISKKKKHENKKC